MAEAVEDSIKQSGATFVLFARDGDPNPMLAGIVPNPSAAIAFVPNDAVWAVLGAARSDSLHLPTLHQWREHQRLMPLARGQHEGHQFAAPFSPPVDFGAETAPATA